MVISAGKWDRILDSVQFICAISESTSSVSFEDSKFLVKPLADPYSESCLSKAQSNV